MTKKSTRYIRRASDNGWTKVRTTQEYKTFLKGKPVTTHFVFLCEYTKVELTKEDNDWQFFNILDGYVAVGMEAALHKKFAEKYLVERGEN